MHRRPAVAIGLRHGAGLADRVSRACIGPGNIVGDGERDGAGLADRVSRACIGPGNIVGDGEREPGRSRL